MNETLISNCQSQIVSGTLLPIMQSSTTTSTNCSSTIKPNSFFPMVTSCPSSTSPQHSTNLQGFVQPSHPLSLFMSSQHQPPQPTSNCFFDNNLSSGLHKSSSKFLTPPLPSLLPPHIFSGGSSVSNQSKFHAYEHLMALALAATANRHPLHQRSTYPTHTNIPPPPPHLIPPLAHHLSQLFNQHNSPINPNSFLSSNSNNNNSNISNNYKAKMVQLKDGELKPLEALCTQDFEKCTQSNSQLELVECRVTLIELSHCDNSARIQLIHGKSTKTMTVPASKPFFTRNNGWVSVCPDLCLQHNKLATTRLQLNSVCLCLVRKQHKRQMLHSQTARHRHALTTKQHKTTTATAINTKRRSKSKKKLLRYQSHQNSIGKSSPSGSLDSPNFISVATTTSGITTPQQSKISTTSTTNNNSPINSSPVRCFQPYQI